MEFFDLLKLLYYIPLIFYRNLYRRNYVSGKRFSVRIDRGEALIVDLRAFQELRKGNP